MELENDKGYRNDFLWLPLELAGPNLAGVKASLEFPVEGSEPVSAWWESETHLIVPREFIPYAEWEDLPFEIEDITQTDWPKVEVATTFDLRGPIQRTSYAKLTEGGSGILSLACGRGKTVIALHAWAAIGVPALIVVHTVDLAHQWKARILEHTDIEEDEIGWVQGKKMDWEKPITIAMIHTLAARDLAGELPVGLRSHFGVVIYDEVHHLGAPLFNVTASVGRGIRWGLSATPNRADGLEALYQYHLGPVLYQNLEQDVIPDTFFIRTGVKAGTPVLSAMKDRAGNLSMAKLYRWLAEDEDRNEKIMATIDEALEDGRSLLCLSPLVDHLDFLYWEYKDSGLIKVGLIKGGVKGETRQKLLKESQLIFATTQLAKEGLDKPDLDTVMVLLPFTNEGQLRQIHGRPSRAYADKQEPVVIIFEDEGVGPCKAMCKKLRHHLTTFEYPFAIVE
jgi:superfamily II DNA or RNA helicase